MSTKKGEIKMNLPVTLLCKNPSQDKDKRMEQALLCAAIDGYTDATAELSRFISKLYQSKNPNTSLVHKTLKPLIARQNHHYGALCAELIADPWKPWKEEEHA